jgi:hypothetical protein
MSETALIVTFMSAGFTIMFALLLIMWHSMNAGFAKIDADLKEVRFEIKEIRTGLNRIEGAFYNKECCMLKSDEKLKKVE